jgi:uncharacterized protein
MRTIALEEHFWSPALASPPGTGVMALLGGHLDALLSDLGEGRLAGMDAAGIDVQVLSHNAPAAQHLPPGESLAKSQEANDLLAKAVRAYPDRFAGFATLPTGDPAAAADELERAITELGFVGAMVHSTLGTNGTFLDDPGYEPLLARAEQLSVPLYLHPSQPPSALADILFQGLPPRLAALLASSAWNWHAEAGLHTLRLVVTGVFDRHPDLRVIIGHCGEMLPFMMDRIDKVLTPERTGLASSVSDYLLRNVWVTTSGMFSLPPLMCTLQVFGVDRVLFSVDYPFAPNALGRAVLDALPLSPEDKAKVAGVNAAQLLGL